MVVFADDDDDVAHTEPVAILGHGTVDRLSPFPNQISGNYVLQSPKIVALMLFFVLDSAVEECAP